MRDCPSNEADCRECILVVNLTPNVFRRRYDILKPPSPTAAGIVYQDVYSAPAALDGGGYSLDVFLVGDVGRQAEAINLASP
jgi:hypothetical protein